MDPEERRMNNRDICRIGHRGVQISGRKADTGRCDDMENGADEETFRSNSQN